MSESNPHSSRRAGKKSKPRSSLATPSDVPASSGAALSHGSNAEASSSKLPVHLIDGSNGPSTSTKDSKKARKEARKAAKAASSSPLLDLSMDVGKGKGPARLDEPSEGSWEAVPLAQSPAARIPHVWSRDGRFFFTVTGSSINIHSGSHPYNRLSTLSAPGTVDAHSQPITALLPHPANSMQLLSASEDGSIKVWDWVEGRFLRDYNLGGPVGGLCTGKLDGKVCAFAFVSKLPDSKSKKSESSYAVVHIPLSGGKDKAVRTLRTISTPPTSIIISPSSRYLVVLAKHKAYAFDLTNRADGRPKQVKFASDQILTCGAFAPVDSMGDREEWFATGDVKGVIRLWHGLSSAFKQVSAPGKEKDAERRLPTTSMHWHAHGVSALAFTSSGAQLLSVGEESVLVQWHLASGRREYVPRLGGKPLQSLSVRASDRAREEEWWMMMSDGSSVKVGASSGKIQTLNQGLRFDPRISASDEPYPIAFHPSSSALVLPSSHPSTLQWVDPSTASVLFDLEVAPSNRVSRRDKEVVPTTVDHIAFSDLVQGRVKWMATLETRESDLGEGGGGMTNLKIWIWQNGRYIVNTQFPHPQGTSDLTSISFSSTPTIGDPQKNDPYLLTTSADGLAKLWHVRTARKSEQGKTAVKKAHGSEQFWAQRSTFNYRDLPITSSAFSPDGTIAALCHGGVVSLWDTESNVMLRALAPSIDAKLSQIIFVGKEGRHLIAAGEGGVFVWDMLSCTLAWSASGAVLDLGVLPASNHFITLSTTASSTHIRLFSTQSATPLRTETTSAVITRLLPLPSSFADPSAHLEFIGLTSTSQIVRIGDRVTAPTATSSSVAAVGEKKTTSVWQEMFGKDAFLEPFPAPSASDMPVLHKAGKAENVFEGPSHTLPSTRLLFDAFLEDVLASSTKPVTEEDVQMGEEPIRFVQTQETVIEAARPMVKPQEVTDKDINSLEVFFWEVLAAPKAQVSKHRMNGVPNGHTTETTDSSDDSDDDVPVPASPRALPKAATKKIAAQRARRRSNGSASASEREEIASGGKGRGMKRKA